MADLEYRPGKMMTSEPINMGITEVAAMLRLNQPVVAILEPGDATRYTLLLVPIGDGDQVSPYLGWLGIQEEDADNYLFVSNLHPEECPGTWVPFGPGVEVGIYDVTDLSKNEWSRNLIAWWLTELCGVSE